MTADPLAHAAAVLKLAAEVLDKDREVQGLYDLQTEVDAPAPANMDELLDQYTQWETDRLPHQPAKDILNEFLQERGRRNRRNITVKCPECEGWKQVPNTGAAYLPKYKDCPSCSASGVVVKPDISSKLEPWAERLEKALHDEFMEWWPTSEASRTRKPETSGTKWEDNPKFPVTHWLNVEDFLNDRYPEAATGSKYGGEYAAPLLEKTVRADDLDRNPNIHDPAYKAKPTPEWLEAHGYIGGGNVITQAFLNLHNHYNRRPWKSKQDKRRTMELLLRHIGPGAAKRDPLKAAAATIRMAQQVLGATGQDLYVSGLTDRLRSEFDEWATTKGKVNPYDAKDMQRGRKPQGPIGIWGWVEDFLQEKYPAAHKGHGLGWEEAQPAIANGNYATGPAAVAAHGYDPKEIAAAMLMLHSQSHPSRSQSREWMKTDLNRIYDIYQKRQEMQRKYEDTLANAKDAMVTARRVLAGEMPTDTIDHLRNEFEVWWDKTKETHDPHKYYRDNPLGSWRNIEKFFKDQYPQVHRGFDMGLEQARNLIDESPGAVKHHDPYPTGDEAFQQYGYDPKEVAASMLFLHNRAHPGRMDEGWLKWDTDRIYDIVQTRHQMHRKYEETLAGAKDAIVTAHRVLAMPAPPPEGLHFKYHHTNGSIPPEYNGKNQGGSHTFLAPAVAAYIGDKPVGYVEWWPTKNYPNAQQHYRYMDKGEPGEVYYIHVHPDHRRSSIASEMFKWAKDNVVPELKHSPKKSELGKKWVSYEEGLNPVTRAAMAIREAQQILAMPQLVLPREVGIKRHQYRDHSVLKNEILKQNGAAILWRTLDSALPGEYLYVARDKQGTIHGVAKAMDIGTHHAISDLYTSLGAPGSTGTKILRTIAQHAKKKGQGLFVTNMLPGARKYWEAMGAVTAPDSPHAEFTPESHQALIDKNTIEAPHTEPNSDFDLMHAIPEDVRKPGSISTFIPAWRAHNRWQDRVG